MRTALLSIILSAGLALPALASPDFTKAVDKASEAFKAAMSDPAVGKLSREDRAKKQTEALNAALKDLDVSKADADDLALVLERFPIIAQSEKAGEIKQRLEALAAAEDAAGASAAESRLMLAMNDRAARDADQRAGAFVKHPGLKDLIKAGKGARGLSALAMFDDEIKENRGVLYGLGDAIPATGPGTGADQLTRFFMALVDATPPEDKAKREPMRLKLVDRVKNALSTASGSDERLTKRLESDLKSLESTLARGEFIGNVAPELHFTWTAPNLTMDGKAPTKLSDLRGKVVVIDFWATWCGPCVRSFPNVRELTAHYQGYDVVVLGVTSLQGNSIIWKDGKPSKTEDTKDNPAKEYELMGAFIKDMDMTWPVAFSQEAVFNPEYGVNGIPHVVILDVDGKVRYRGLHPANPLPEKIEKIDKLLKEAGRKTPEAQPAGEAKPATK